eukprot:7386135-Prymnesium_polylepis.1
MGRGARSADEGQGRVDGQAARGGGGYGAVSGDSRGVVLGTLDPHVTRIQCGVWCGCGASMQEGSVPHLLDVERAREHLHKRRLAATVLAQPARRAGIQVSDCDQGLGRHDVIRAWLLRLCDALRESSASGPQQVRGATPG